jgi:hypothetical protein
METTIKHKRMMALIAAVAGLAWAGLVGLVFLLNSGDYGDFWFPGRTLTYILLLVAPALTFIPMGRVLNMPFYGYWSVISWAVFGFIFAFLTPDPNQSRDQNLTSLVLLLVSFFAALVSLFLPICYAIGVNVFARAPRPARYDLRRSVREAILLALYVVLLATLQLMGGLTWLYALMFFLIIMVIELLILSRSRIR